MSDCSPTDSSNLQPNSSNEINGSEIEEHGIDSTKQEEPQDRRRLPGYVYNPTSLIGAVLAASMFIAILVVALVDSTSAAPNPYIGIIGFAILPVPLIIGLLLIPIGMWFEWRRRRRIGFEERRLPSFDMNRPEHRRAFVIFAAGTILFFFLTAGGSYKAFEYTESVSFCGTLCHEVMEPEYTTYLVGPHARVKCVECHVGEGAGWYVRSKLAGAYQIYSVLFNKYPRPIPTPIENLRPARETCEHCHWPAKFHGNQMWEISRYLNDENNTLWSIRMVMKTGGSDETSGRVHGIHWHIAQEVEYVAADSTRQEIREVRFHRSDGSVETYMSGLNPLSDEERSVLPEEEVRTMDCMDCHNRPSHQYLSPRWAMDHGLQTGRIPNDLPYMKRLGTNLLAGEYTDYEDALQTIEEGMLDYYRENYSEIFTQREEELINAIAGVKELYSTYFFPYMRARWSAYPTQIGHQEYPGCYRCHNGMMSTDEGRVIRNDCQLCHTILSQGPGVAGVQTADEGGIEFRHPEEIGEAWRIMTCHECHTGGEYY